MGKTHIVFGAFALLGLGFGACSMFSPGAPGNNAVATLAGIAASKNTTVATIVTKGQLFCQSASGIVALVKDLSSPTSVIGVSSTVVADACATINATPVPPPTNVPLDSVPVAVAPMAKVPAQS